MLISNFPTFSYVTWQGLIIVGTDNIPHIINDANTNCKYIYWETSNPLMLNATNEKLATSATRYLIYINDNGIATQVPQDIIEIQYRDVGSGTSGSITKIQGQVNELNGKYFAIKEDLDSLEQIIGSSTTVDGSIVDRVNKIEQTANGTLETINQIQTKYNDDKEAEKLRDDILSSLIAMITSLSEYQNEVSNTCKDFEITNEEMMSIVKFQNNFLEKSNIVFANHDILIRKIDNDNNANIINALNLAKTNLETSIQNLNTNINTSISDFTIIPSEITTMINMFGVVGVRAEDYKNTLSDAIVLGTGGEVIENMLIVNKTASEFNQSMSEIVEIIDGETGLKTQIEKNTTNINQTAEEIRLNYVKYNQTTAELSVSDNTIKLDAGKVLMTGTLTWDSLDSEAQTNLKGKDGENGTAEYVMLVGDQFIKYDAQGIPSRTSVTINVLMSNMPNETHIKWAYKQENSNTWNDILSNNDMTYYQLEENSGIWGNMETITIRVTVNEIYYDEMTIVKIKDGIDGNLAEYVELMGGQAFKYTIKKGETDFTSTPTVITLEGVAHNINTTNTRWYYKLPGQTEWILMTENSGKFIISVFPDDPILFANNDTVQIRFELNTHYDTITISKLYDGKDSVMAILSNETHLVPCEFDGTPISLEGATTTLSIYVGSINDTDNWSITTVADGVVGTLSNNNKTFTVTSLSSDIGYVDFIARKNNFDSITKRFTITKTKSGQDGSAGISYWVSTSVSVIVKREDNTLEPSIISLNAKCKEGKEGVTNYEGTFIVSELINDEWITRYISQQAESSYDYTVSDNPTIVKIELYSEDNILLDEENIPIVLDGTVTPVAFLDNDAHTIPCNSDGEPLSYEGASTNMYIFTGSIDDSSNWNYSATEVGVVGIFNNGSYQVTKINNNNAYVDITAKKSGYEDLTRRFSIAKAIYGQDGTNAKYVYVVGEQVFKYADDFKGTPIPSSITLQATKYNITSNGMWQYKNGNQYVDMNITTDNITITPTSGLLESHNACTFRFIAEDYSDEITIIKVSDGSNGLPGSDGQDGIYILITNESHTVPCDSQGNYTATELAKATTEVHIYRGLEEIDGNITLVTSGCQALYNRATKTITTTQLTENTATITINIIVDGKTFTKIMTITKSLQGTSGKDGAGINVIGKLSSTNDLPSDGNPGDAYLINGLLYLWSEADNIWLDGVPIRGEQGLPGKDGIDGRTTYFHIKYSNDGKTFTANNGETPGDWLGQYTDFYEQDSNVFSDYEWKKIKGENGEHGIVANLSNDSHIVPCLDDGTGCIFTGCSSKISLFLGSQELTNGVSYSYSASQNVGGNWDNITGTYTVTVMNNVDNGYVDLTAIYNGISYTKRFTITKSKQGADSYTINLSNDNHSFVANSNGIIEYAQTTTIEITAYKGNVKQNVTIGELPDVNGLTLTSSSNSTITITTNNSLPLAISGTIDIPITVNNRSFTKTFTYTRVDCGKDGINGVDGYTIYLTNELHSYYSENNGNITEQQSTITTVKAFYGSTEKTPTIGNITVPSGMTITKNGATLTITANTGTSLANNGSFNIPITVDGRSFIKVFSWVKTRKGQDGVDGINAKYVVVSGEQVFKYTNGNTTPTPSSIVLSASKFNTTSNGVWQYKNANGTYVDLGSTSTTIEITPTSGLLNTNDSCTFRYIVENVYYDEMTIVKISDGVDGQRGQTFYTWIMYADNENGGGISNNPTGKSYIGLSYNNITSTESTNPLDYKWTLIKGTNGINGVNGVDGKTYYTWIKYSDSANGSNMYDTPNANTQYIGIAVNKTTQTESTNASDYSWSKFKGDDGVNGKDAYTIVLTNENHSFIAESNGNILTALATTCQVLAYKGATPVTPTIGNITVPNGMTITKNGATLTITANTGTSLANNGSFNIPITVDGITFNKAFSWTKVLKGANGKDGTELDLPSWITEWDGNATTINGSSVITPKIFAGTISSGKPTGVAIGKDVFGTNSSYPVNGIVGYKNGVKTYEFNSNGNMLIGNTNGQHISWDGSNLTMNVNSLKISSSNVATETYVDNIQIGGRNLLKKSNQEINNNNYAIANYYFGDVAPIEGEIYTITLKGRLGSDRTDFRAYNSGGYVSVYTLKPIGNGIFTATGVWKASHTDPTYTPSNTYIQIYQFTNTGTSSSTIEWIKLEKGNKATDWTPAPEDMDDKLLVVEQNLNSNIDNVIRKETSDMMETIDEMYASQYEFDVFQETITSEFSQTNEKIEMKFSTVLEASNTINNNLETYKASVQNYIRFDNNGIELGKSNSPFKTNLSNTKLSFSQSGHEVAYISNNKMYITSAEITADLRLGRFIWIIGSNGNLTLKWS